MKNLFLICAIPLLLGSCEGESQNKYLTYKNIVILSDLSSRIENKPVKDIGEIHSIVQFFKDSCVKAGQKIGDKSCITFSTFSSKIIAAVNIEGIKDLGEKQRFINSTGEYEGKGLLKSIDEFEQNVKFTYANTRNKGLDLISILIDKIQNEPIVKKDNYLTDGIDTTFVTYDNDIYIFTDGYLEYLNKRVNNQFYFGTSEIDKVRQFCKANNVDIITALKTNASLRLPANLSANNHYVTLHILETHERDKNDLLQTYKYPTGLRDNEILEAVWREWATESGFKNFYWSKY